MRAFMLVLGFLVIRGSVAFPGTAVAATNSLKLPANGQVQVRLLAPALLEFTAIQRGTEAMAKNPPSLDPGAFTVDWNGRRISIARIGFKRRPVYAPLRTNDLRVASTWFLQLGSRIPENATVEVTGPESARAARARPMQVTHDPYRLSPVLHANQTGYLPAHPKKAMVGYYLGTLGEMNVSAVLGSRESPLTFQVIHASSRDVAFEGRLRSRPDKGFPFESYQDVLEADFTPLKTPGEYRLFVPGLGVSWPFWVSEEVAGAVARTYALGIYHQRCGAPNETPFTRFTHGPCHVAPAEIPTMAGRFASANHSLEKETENFRDDPKHTAPRLKSIGAALYPFVSRGTVNVRGGHHDAGDYSKYTINSAGFVHHLVFAADAFPGAADLDNLGLPESGDAKSDVLQLAKWEADFLSKMQDQDGGFYFLVYPREREYENDVLPDRGDPQVVFPKTTSSTAAAVAALAQCAGSPRFKTQFPNEAARYLDQARKGWAFLQEAIQKHGLEGAYQKITHYGHEFRHNDELAWAATELFAATGEDQYHEEARQWLRPADPGTRKWGWLRLFDSYGNAARSYAFAARSGRLKPDQLHPALLRECEDELIAAANDQAGWARDSAYGTSLSQPTKQSRSAGWYFPADAAFDLAVASQLGFPQQRDPRPGYLDALISNLNYEQGCNPVNVTFLTGLGWQRQQEIVHQFAQNDRRALPPSGIPLGSIQEGFGWLDPYRELPGKLSFPLDGADSAPYPFYDRWIDGFNLMQEFVILHQARGLGYAAWLMAQTPLSRQSWRAAPAKVQLEREGAMFKAQLVAEGLDLSKARVVWEAAGADPWISGDSTPIPGQPAWIEAEAQLPDGRRVFGILEGSGKLAKGR